MRVKMTSSEEIAEHMLMHRLCCPVNDIVLGASILHGILPVKHMRTEKSYSSALSHFDSSQLGLFVQRILLP